MVTPAIRALMSLACRAFPFSQSAWVERIIINIINLILVIIVVEVVEEEVVVVVTASVRGDPSHVRRRPFANRHSLALLRERTDILTSRASQRTFREPPPTKRVAASGNCLGQP